MTPAGSTLRFEYEEFHNVFPKVDLPFELAVGIDLGGADIHGLAGVLGFDLGDLIFPTNSGRVRAVA
jgi:hypothetical protein